MRDQAGGNDKNKGEGKEAFGHKPSWYKPMEFYVKTFSGDSLLVEAHPSHTIADVKAKLPILHPGIDIDTDVHIVIKIAQDMRLADHNIKPGDVLYVVRTCGHQVFDVVDEASEYSTHSSEEFLEKEQEKEKGQVAVEDLSVGESGELEDALDCDEQALDGDGN